MLVLNKPNFFIYAKKELKLLWSTILKKYDDFDIIPTQLSRVIRDNNITRKRTRIRHYPETRYNKKIDFKKEMKVFYDNVDKYNLSKIISIDETSIHAEMTASYSICALGKRFLFRYIRKYLFPIQITCCPINWFVIVFKPIIISIY